MQRLKRQPPNVATAEQRPANYDHLKRVITDNYEGLSRRLQEVGEYALAHPDDMALETIAVIAARAKVPPSSLIRFSKALGFGGFTEMQRLFRDRLVAHAPTYGERIRRLHGGREQDDGSLPSAMIHDFSTIAIEGLERLRQDLPPERLEAALEILSGAELIHVAGLRRAFPVASYLAYLLTELGCRTFLLDGIGGMLHQQRRMIGPGSVLLAVSFRPYAPEVAALVESCRGDGVPIVGITDGPLSPIARLADVSFEVVESEVQGFRPLCASMCLSLVLAVSLGHHIATKPATTGT
ncbi:MAG: MurR/RpiR family transcriptional regulator [Geminicoccaceae bacterium]